MLDWSVAVAPVALLLALVLWGRLPTWFNAGAALGVGCILALTAVDADPLTVLVGAGKGAWVGVWILYVVVPALLMHHAATRMGMTALGARLGRLMSGPTETVLLLAWVLPSFLQGVSGFGTPVAVAAPLLVAVGIAPVRAVALVLIGYQWSVGFGSMGSSFYMGALTARLDAGQTADFAVAGSLLLGVNAVVAGVLVCLLHGGPRGLRAGLPMLVLAGPAMALGQALAVRLEPGIGALVGGGCGILAVVVLRGLRRLVSTGGRPVAAGDAGDVEERRRARNAAVPYLALAVVALALFVPPPARELVRGHLLLGPSFPATQVPGGTTNAALSVYNPIAVLGHPGSILLVALAISLVVWRVRGARDLGLLTHVVRPAARQSLKTGPPVVILGALAGVLVDAGMVRTIAEGAADATGSSYPLLAPVVGALGSFITGSTTNSNALFAALQADVAQLIGAAPPDLLAGQLAGGNVGNALAPVVVLLGLSAVGATDDVGRVVRAVLPPALLLLAVMVGGTWLLTL